MTLADFTLDSLQDYVGRELGVSEWLLIDQARIDQFADGTDDRQWIHVDVERARRDSPFGAPVAHGYLLLALLPRWYREVGVVPAGVRHTLNYGLERVRFITPVRVGARVRTRVVVLKVDVRGDGRVLLTCRATVEIEGEERPALVAETLALLVTA
jgi:acyl dehydratase